MLNYLARLGWSHGDDELFTRDQLVSWFDGTHLNKSPAQWDPAKLLWVNAQYIKQADNTRLAKLVAVQLAKQEVNLSEEQVTSHLPLVCSLLKDRCDTTVALAGWAAKLYADVKIDPAERAQHVTDAVKPAIKTLAERLVAVEWNKAAIAAAIKEVLAAHGLKMPQLAMPVRVLLLGTPQTPSLDAVVELMEREKVLARLAGA
jgi:glutamyl-tRNA synthetase